MREMTIKFPSPEWLQALFEKLNSDERYAQVAKSWEGDMLVVIEPTGLLNDKLLYYLDLWHGKCRKIEIFKQMPSIMPKFILTSNYTNISRIMKGEPDPMQAMLTRKLQVHGNMAYMMRNVPIVLDFVRCAREVTTEIL
jgi:putative sterol carrier protein